MPDTVKTAHDAITAAGGLVTPQEIAAEWGISAQAVAQRIADGKFPEPIKVAGRTRLYLRDQLAPYRHGNRHLARREHPTFWDYLASEGERTHAPVELLDLLRHARVPLGARRRVAVTNYLERHGIELGDVAEITDGPF